MDLRLQRSATNSAVIARLRRPWSIGDQAEGAPLCHSPDLVERAGSSRRILDMIPNHAHRARTEQILIVGQVATSGS
ncbi:MAG: hypothetical protein AUK55_11980 [Syntrophobacteraceae bacterium CG2_30_61_12]|nr:MAG: hypothetical protein AUK55_11980 [Syntrophobacteraceae bacterium CG2_30_61_12]